MVKVALCQMSATDSLDENIRKMVSMAHKAAAECPKLDVIVFPEYCYGRPPYIPALSDEGVHTQAIAQAAKQLGVNIVAGTFARQSGSGKRYNTSYFYNQQGEIMARYDKAHLMVAMGFDESEFVEYGQSRCVFETSFGRVGLMVCYDLRFPELARSMVMDGADILLCPAEFPSGRPLPARVDHWDTLLKSTALLNQVWTVGCNQYGVLPDGEKPFGRSMVVDPWGSIVAQCQNGETICYVQLDMDYQQRVRDSLATWSNRRPEMYRTT